MRLQSRASLVVIAAAWLVAAVDAQPRPAHKRIAYQKVEFRGEVKAREDFRRLFGPGLVFWLTPHPDGSGWTIEVCEAVETSCGNDFVWMVSPPYRSSNPRYLDTSYGISAAAAVKWSPRQFRFVVRKEDYERAGWLYERLYSSRPDQERMDEAEREHYHNDFERLTAHAGKGTLWITGSTIKEGKVESVKFRVRLEVPKGSR